MKVFIKVIISVLMLTPVLVIGSVLAVEDSTGAPTESDSLRTTTTRPVETEEQTEARLEAAMKARIEQRKNELNLQLSAAQRTRLSQRCKPSQTLIRNLNDKVSVYAPQRYEAYDALNEHLAILFRKLESSDVDTRALENYQTVLVEKISTFKLTMETYQLALSDLSAMNCGADLEGFQATLESARKLREDLAKMSGDIQTYVKESIKPALDPIRQQLLAKNKTEGEN